MKRKHFNRVTYRPLFVSAYEFYQRDLLSSLTSLQPKTHMETLTDTTGTKEGFLGDKRLSEIRTKLDQITGFDRSEMQKRFHENFLQAVALHLYRDDLDIDMDKIMSQNDWVNLKQQVLCLTPRRFGKTTAVSMFVGAYGLSVSKSNQCIFSTGKRASDKLLEQVMELIKLIDDGTGTNYISWCKRKGEILYITNPDNPDDIRKISSYPSGSKALRGVGGDVIYLEEAAFMSVSMFHEVIVPLLEMETTALICISTPQESTNFYSVMFNMRDPAGQKLFNTIELSMVCEDCKKTTHPEKCTHMKHLLPKWKSAGKQDMVRQIYGENTTDMLRESMGVTTSDNSSIFDDKWLDLFTSRPPRSCLNRPTFIFCSCDPNGGGSSRMGVVSLIMQNNTFMICGMEAHAVKGHGEVNTLLKTHVLGLRRTFPTAHIIFIPESNLGHEASHMAHMLKDIPKFTSLVITSQSL